MRIVLAAAAALTLTACAPNDAIVGEFNGDSVTIVTNQLAANQTEARRNADAEATRICRKAGRSGAEFASMRQNQYNYENYLLYLCL